MNPDRHPALTAAPDELLHRRNAHRLMAWLEKRGHRPSLLALEQERTRRGIASGTHPEKENNQ